MYLYLFEIYGRVEFVDEKTAHNYIRNPSGAQKATLRYLGAVEASKRIAIIKEIEKEKIAKFGKIGQGEENDALILESREFMETMLKEKNDILIATADKTIMPRTLDYMYTMGQNADSAQSAASLKDAINKLKGQ